MDNSVACYFVLTFYTQVYRKLFIQIYFCFFFFFFFIYSELNFIYVICEVLKCSLLRLLGKRVIDKVIY